MTNEACWQEYEKLVSCSKLFKQIEITLHLTLSWRRPLSYRNQSIDLLCKWFLYDNGLRHERVNEEFQSVTNKLSQNKHLFVQSQR